MSLPTLAWDDDAGLRTALEAAPRALVLYQGTRCPYSATLRPHFEAAAARPERAGWAFLVRHLDETREEGWDERGVRVTPTIVAYVEGREAARIEGKVLLGITRQALARWLKTLPPA